MTSKVAYQLPVFERFAPKTRWAGGHIAHTDMLTLPDAARLATEHAGAAIDPADILRAAARGQIPLHAICRRDVVMLPTSKGDEPMKIPELALPTLPLSACQSLSHVGLARWRHYDGFARVEAFGGGLCRYRRWELADGEPDLETVQEDCRLTGYAVHAIADAIMAGAPAPNTETPAAAEPAQKETAKQRRERLLQLHDAEVSAGRGYGALARITEIEKRTRPTADRANLGRDIRKARQEREADRKGGALVRLLE